MYTPKHYEQLVIQLGCHSELQGHKDSNANAVSLSFGSLNSFRSLSENLERVMKHLSERQLHRPSLSCLRGNQVVGLCIPVSYVMALGVRIISQIPGEGGVNTTADYYLVRELLEMEKRAAGSFRPQFQRGPQWDCTGVNIRSDGPPANSIVWS